MVQKATSAPVAPNAKLVLHNPSPYPRGGVVVTPWQPIAKLLGNPPSVRVFREHDSGNRVQLVAQIDRIDPSDPSRDQLVFALDYELPPGDEDYIHPRGYAVVEPSNDPPPAPGPRADRYFTGVKMLNERLEVWLNTASHHNIPENQWFGGAVTSVQLDHFEMLDPIAADLGLPHHPDKRCMQIDRIHLVRPPWDEDGSHNAFVFDKPWRCVATASGPLRATATIVSSPFEYHCRDADQRERTFVCTVHRAISIFAGRDVIFEKMWVTGNVDGAVGPVDLWFSPRYFMLLNLTFGPVTFRYPNHPGWFAVVSETRPFHGYAFATDAYAGPIWHPPLEHADEDTRHFAYSWELGATRLAHAAHIFRRDTNQQQLTDAAGWTWYDLAFKPLRAKL